MKPKKKNPSDLTLRNLRALKKRVEKLEDRSRFLEDLLDKQEEALVLLTQKTLRGRVNEANREEIFEVLGYSLK